MAESCFNSKGFSWKKLRKFRRKTFRYKCPYTDRFCLSFDCENCNVDEYENKRLLEYLNNDPNSSGCEDK